MQEVETEEDPPLQQQAEKTDTVPDDPSLFYWETAGLVTHYFCCQEKKDIMTHTKIKKHLRLSLLLPGVTC